MRAITEPLARFLGVTTGLGPIRCVLDEEDVRPLSAGRGALSHTPRGADSPREPDGRRLAPNGGDPDAERQERTSRLRLELDTLQSVVRIMTIRYTVLLVAATLGICAALFLSGTLGGLAPPLGAGSIAVALLAALARSRSQSLSIVARIVSRLLSTAATEDETRRTVGAVYSALTREAP